MAGPAEGRVPAISLNRARPRHDDRDHRDAPLRGAAVMTRKGRGSLTSRPTRGSMAGAPMTNSVIQIFRLVTAGLVEVARGALCRPSRSVRCLPPRHDGRDHRDTPL